MSTTRKAHTQNKDPKSQNKAQICARKEDMAVDNEATV